MAVLTPAQIRLIMGPVCSVERAEACAPALISALGLAGATTVTRAAAMLAQIAWECAQLRILIEPESEGTAKYDGGSNFRGRGFIQLTHRYNYRAAGEALSLPLESTPDLAAHLDVAARVTAWYWTTHHLNELVDAREFRAVTEKINGRATDGPPSYHERRERYYHTALEVIGLGASF